MRITGSGLARLSKCLAVATLPWSHEETDAASFGTVGHEFLSNIPVLGYDDALLLVPEEHREAMAQIQVDELPASEPAQYGYEVAIAYDTQTDTARELGRGGGRHEGPDDDRTVCGTMDVVAAIPGKKVWVLDYKFGWPQLPPVAENWQLRFYALSAARVWDAEEASVAIVRVPTDGGSPFYDKGELSAMDLHRTAVELRELVDQVLEVRASGKQAEPRLGGHCKYCPAMFSCPAVAGLLEKLGKGEDPTAGFEPVEAFTRAEVAELAMKKVWEAMDRIAKTKHIELEHGWRYGPKKHPTTVYDADASARVLEEVYGVDVAMGSLKLEKKVTGASIGRGLRPWVKRTPGAKITAAKESAIELLKERKAATVKYATRIMKHKPKADDLEASADEAITPTEAPTPEGEADGDGQE